MEQTRSAFASCSTSTFVKNENVGRTQTSATLRKSVIRSCRSPSTTLCRRLRLTQLRRRFTVDLIAHDATAPLTFWLRYPGLTD
jgi:hypothetical protein